MTNRLIEGNCRAWHRFSSFLSEDNSLLRNGDVTLISLYICKQFFRRKIYNNYVRIFLFYLVYNMLSNSGLPAIISLMSLVSAFLTLAILIITLFWKISIHTTAMGGMLASFICISGELSISPVIICAVLILLCGLVAFSRIKTNAHQPAQVYAGFLMGILITGLFFYFMY